MSAALNAEPCKHCKLLEQLRPYLAEPCTCGGAAARVAVDDHAVARTLVGWRIAHEKKLEDMPEGPEKEFVRGLVDGMQRAIDVLRGRGVDVEGEPARVVKRPKKAKPDHLAIVPPHFTPLPSAGVRGARPAGTRRMLEALERVYPMALTRKQLSTMALVADGGTLSTYLSMLREDEAIEDLADGRVIARKGSGKKPPTLEELVELWASRLTGKARAMFYALVRLYPQAVSRDDLRAAVGGFSNGGTFSTYLSKLTTNGLAEEQPDKTIRAGAVLFLAKKGRRS